MKKLFLILLLLPLILSYYKIKGKCKINNRYINNYEVIDNGLIVGDKYVYTTFKSKNLNEIFFIGGYCDGYVEVNNTVGEKLYAGKYPLTINYYFYYDIEKHLFLIFENKSLKINVFEIEFLDL